MKRIITLTMILGVLMIITPLIAVRYERAEDTNTDSELSLNRDNTIKVMSAENGFIKTVDIKEYLVGSVAGEMPVSYHKEALKAQAVACYTYAKYISVRDEYKLGGADISDDSSIYQSYINQDKRKEKWKDNFEANEKIVSEAVDSVLYQYVSFENKPAMTVYHNICSGFTESAENVWGEKYSYLVAVTSNGDKLSPDFKSETELTVADFNKILSDNGLEKYNVGNIVRFDSGYVKFVEIGDETVSGTEFREMFCLKSADFDIETKDNNIIITCRGHGHFVGMSQYGADYMARQGSDYKEILNHFYPGTQLISLNQ